MESGKKISKIKNFLENQVWKWVSQNIETQLVPRFPSKKNFKILPVDESDPNSKDIVNELCDQFSTTSLSSSREFDGLCISVLNVGDKKLICGMYRNGGRFLKSLSNNENKDLLEAELTFLQKILVLSFFDIGATESIDIKVWESVPIFEKDIERYMPEMLVYELAQEDAKEEDDFIILRFLLSLELVSSNAHAFQNEIFTVLQFLLATGHDWLTNQFLSAMLSSRNSSYFAEIYKLVEFFFPLQNVLRLKQSTSFSGSTMELLSFCRADLKWNQNHHMGARASVAYATPHFAEILLEKLFSETNKDEIKFKEEAIERISVMRHSIVHQDFKDSAPSEDDLRRATHAMLIFLAESFNNYVIESSS
ncbi:hypothetical protein [Undibacterium sp. Tian12W]|uniref:hypothetical protein n=1 Tax=Undibacterium sp. Tian12W TaxID=3413054 RepID=UPI003BEF7F13